MRILLATSNPGKQQKLRWLLEGFGVACVVPSEIGPFLVVEETGATHRENAEHKASVSSRLSGLPAIASDGGLVIPVLGERWEALHTGRFAGPSATDRDKLDGLLSLMRPYRGHDRQAFWKEAVAIASNGRLLKLWEAQSPPGFIAESYDPSRILPGFWAFSLWKVPHLGKTYDRLSREEIEALDDHWGILRRAVREWLHLALQA